MKKLPIYLCAGLLALPLAACGALKGSGASKVTFRDNFTVLRTLSEPEKNVVVTKMKEALKGVSKFSMEQKNLQETTFVKNEGTATASGQIYSNGYMKTVTTNKSETVSHGVKSVANKVVTEETWLNKNEKAVCYYAVTNDKYEKTESVGFGRILYEIEDEDKVVNQLADDLMLDLIYMIEDEECEYGLAKNGNYILQNTGISESYSAVTWGTNTKELHMLNRDQIYVEVSGKDYKIKDFTMYSDIITNRDPETGEWYKKDKTTSKSQSRISLTYANRKAVSDKVISELNVKVTGEYISSIDVMGALYNYNSETGIATPVNTFNAVSKKFTRTSYDNFHVVATFRPSLTNTNNAFALNGIAATYPTIGSSTMDTAQTSFVFREQMEGFKLVSTNGSEYIVLDVDAGGTVQPTFTVEFDFTGHAVNNLVCYVTSSGLE